MRSDNKIEVLKSIIRDLHRGVDVEILKKRFTALATGVSAGEIGEMEQQLIAEGLPAEEIRKLCDLHVKVFEEGLGPAPAPLQVPGHPLQTLADENKAVAEITAQIREALDRLGGATGKDVAPAKARLAELLDDLGQIERHYLKKENQLFPRLEAKGISGPSKVMWAVHDDIRAHIKDLRRALDLGDAGLIARTGQWVLQEIADMVAKEEKVLFPMALETLDESDWIEAKKGEEEIGYAWIAPPPAWPLAAESPAAKAVPAGHSDAAISLDRGVLSREQIDLILTRLPFDVTYVDENDVVVYYSGGPDRVFPRTPGIIGRKVQNCHPPKSLDVVERILRSFRSGERDVAEFWIDLNGRFVHIRYFALRDGAGAYRGTLEVTQDATAVRALRGERRLLDWDRPKTDGEI